MGVDSEALRRRKRLVEEQPRWVAVHRTPYEDGLDHFTARSAKLRDDDQWEAHFCDFAPSFAKRHGEKPRFGGCHHPAPP